ncbi:hybrid sensor histidine kinase/response regulator [Colwellia hornerae]|nr:hybrid sensor histidine kinase/response regulator [Colwellia hornerae]
MSVSFNNCKIKLSLFLFFILLLPSYFSLATVQSTRFDRLSIEDGLPQSDVAHILQDKQGFLWVGTSNGLARYDGYTFKVFKHSGKNHNSLTGNVIRTIFEDKNANLWIGTEVGLNHFNPRTEQFSHFRHNANNPQSLSHDVVNAITQDRSGNIWVGTRGGINRFDAQTGQFSHYRYDVNNPNSLSHDNVWAILEDNNGEIWVGTQAGLSRFDAKTKQFSHYLYNENALNSITEGTVWSIITDKQNNLWMITENGLNRFNLQTEQFTHYRHEVNHSNSLSDGIILTLAADKNGNLWIGTSLGLNRLNLKTEIFTYYRHEEANINSIGYGGIMAILEDREGNIWSGTNKAGLSRFNPKIEQFGHYRRDILNPASLSNNWVAAIVEDQQGNLWVGVDSEGINRFNKKTQQFEHYSINKTSPENVSNNWVNAVTKDYQDNIWFSSRNALNKFTLKTEAFSTYRHSLDNSESLGIQAITEDSQNNLWVGTTKGLDYFLTKTAVFKTYQHSEVNSNSLSHNHILAITEDSQKNLWVATAEGLNYFNPKTEVFTHYRHDMAQPNSLSHNYITSIALDAEGNLWVGTMNGLNLMDMKSGEFISFNEEDGLPDSTIYAIEIDDQGFLWLSTNQGLSQFNPKSQTFKNYDVGDGLQSNEFNAGASYKSDSGELFFGGINGFNRFYPEKLIQDNNKPVVVFTEMLLLNQSVAIDPNKKHETNKVKSDDDSFVLDKGIHATSAITLTHKENLVAFEFSALHFSAPKKNQYAYKLEGFDDNWIMTNYKNRRATYTNLPDGEYLLRVKASNPNGIWNEEGVSLKITVLPPFWNSWWAYTLYFISSLIILVFFVRAHQKKAIFERDLIRQLEHQVFTQTASIKQESKKVIKANEVKSQFLANMSHEIRTPLTSIIGQTEAILHGDIDNSADGIKVIYNNSLHLLSLLNDTLDLSKIEANKFELEVTPLDLIQIFVDIKNIFSEQAKSKGLNFTIHHSLPSPFMINIDGFRLKQILINLCSNAIKFTEKGHVAIEIHTQHYSHINELTFKVRDTGIGISDEQLRRVFDAFTQADTSISRRFGGSGLGLNLSEKLADFMGGIIDVESKLGQGSVFTLILPFTPTSETAIVKEFKVTEKTYSGVILLAEDHDDNRHLMTRLLTGLGFEVYTATNGFEVIESYFKNKPDLILLDIQMPKMDGIEAIKILRARSCEIPIIALTANTLAKELEQYLTLGFNGFQAKPFERQNFINTIAKYFEKPINNSREENSSLTDNSIDISDLVAKFEVGLIAEHKNFILLDRENDIETLAKQAHRLAGAAQMFGYTNITRIAMSLESSIKRKNEADIKAITKELIAALLTVINKSDR